MSIVRFNPWRDFDELFGHVGPRGAAASRWVPPVDIYETETGFQIDVELPAVKPEDVDVSVDKGLLTISGELTPADNGRQLRGERRHGSFQRSFRLPENVSEDNVSATARDGVLSVVLTKAEEEKPRRIEIKAA